MNKFYSLFSKTLFLFLSVFLFFSIPSSSLALTTFPISNNLNGLTSNDLTLYSCDSSGKNCSTITEGQTLPAGTNFYYTSKTAPNEYKFLKTSTEGYTFSKGSLNSLIAEPSETQTTGSSGTSKTQTQGNENGCGLLDVTCSVLNFGIAFVRALVNVFVDIGTAILSFSINNDGAFSGWGYTSSDNEAINIGWPIVRNLANAALLIGLIIIAINIILGNNEEQAKRNLINFIIIALLINFTPVICSFIINASDIIMNNFLTGGIDSSYKDQLTKSLLFADKESNQISKLIYTLSVLVFSLVYFSICCLYALLFAARRIMLWILIIVSPIALATRVFPQSKYVKKFFPNVLHWDDWSEQFAQWVIIGIPAGLFMYIANTMMAQIGTTESGTIIGQLVAFLIPIVFLVVGYIITVSSGGQAGSYVSGLGTGAWAATGAKAISKTKALGQTAWEKTGGWAGERAGAAKTYLKEGAIGVAGSLGSGLKTGEEGKLAREQGRYQFREWMGKPREVAANYGLVDPNTLNRKTEQQKEAEEKAKGIDLEHYETYKDKYDSVTRGAIEKKLMEEDMGKFLKGAKSPEEYQRRILSISKNGNEKAREKALMAAYGNSNAGEMAKLAETLNIKAITKGDDKGENKKTVEEFIVSKIKDKDSLGLVDKSFFDKKENVSKLSSSQLGLIAKEGEKEKIENINKLDMKLSEFSDHVQKWVPKAPAASAVFKFEDDVTGKKKLAPDQTTFDKF